MQVRLLGSVDVLVDGAARELPGLRSKAVLAALAVRPGEIVSTDQVVDAVWGDHPPGNAMATLQNHISRLRTLLRDRAAIVARAPGYRLKLGEDATDVQAAQRLIDAASECTDAGEREGLLRDAVALWRGQPLADVAGQAGLIWFDQHLRRLEQLGLQARMSLLDTRLELGQHGQAIPDLEELAGAHPWNERIHRQLMLALYRAGRQCDALAVFRRLRDTLGAELGVEPGVDLQQLETAILRHDPTLAVADSAESQSLTFVQPSEQRSLVVPAQLAADILRQDATLGSAEPLARPVTAGCIVPAQLPSPVDGFSGRARELQLLDELLPEPPADPSGSRAPLLVAICGAAGVGKTTLAVRWARRVVERFPDGQLYVNLRGFDPNPQAVHPTTALRVFLDALGVPSERIPPTLEGQVGLYRSVLAGKHVLVVLDNARTAEQVRPLLPASPGCGAVVTSRHQLTGLVATNAARLLTLQLLSAAEAYELLAYRLGDDRLSVEPDAAGGIINRCAGLPLALAITAARAAVRPGYPLAAIAAELRDAAALDALGGDDPATDIRGVFSWSCRALQPEAGRLSGC